MKSLLSACVLYLLLYLTSCQVKSYTPDPSFGQYISGYTSGTISNNEKIKIELAYTPNQKGFQEDSNFIQNNFKISPSIDGKFYWENERTIIFQPTKNFKENTIYTFQCNLNKFVEVSKKYKNFKFQCKTVANEINVDLQAMSYYNSVDLKYMFMDIQINSNFILDTVALLKCFHIKSDNKNLKLKYINKEEKFYALRIDSIERNDVKKEFSLNWNFKNAGADKSDQKTIAISALGDFHITNVKIEDNGDQAVKITFSDPLRQQQDLRGLIAIENVKIKNFYIQGNEVTAYLEKRTIGEKKINFEKGILNANNTKMNKSYADTITFMHSKPALRMESKGCILPNSNGLIFPFESIGLHTVDVRVIKILEKNMHQFLQVNELNSQDELTRVGKIIYEKKINLIKDTIEAQNQWTTHILELSKMIQPEPGSLYRVCIRFKKKYTYSQCEESPDSENEAYAYHDNFSSEENWEEYQWHGEGFDGYDTWNYNDDYYNVCDPQYYEGKAICKNILASDIGVIYKEDKEKNVYILSTNLLTASAMNDVKIELYNYTKELIAESNTDANGITKIKIKEKPFLLIAKKNNQRTYMKLSEQNKTTLSKFDVEGSTSEKSIDGFMYAERGVWRPGDSVFLNFVLLDKNTYPNDFPIKFQLIDESGNIKFEEKRSKHVAKIYPLNFKTNDNYLPGNYEAKVIVNSKVFTKKILIETILPNRLKINFPFENKILSDTSSRISWHTEWMMGATAKNLKTQLHLSFQPNNTFFSKHKNYIFDAGTESKSDMFELYNGVTDSVGNSNIDNLYSKIKKPNSIMNANFLIKVFETNGAFSIDKFEAILSPYNSYIGMEKAQDKYFDNTKTINLKYISVDANQNKISCEKIHVKIYDIAWKNWYESDKYDLTNFTTQKTTYCVFDSTLSAKNGEGVLQFFPDKNKRSRYLITMLDKTSGHSISQIIYTQNENSYYTEESEDQSESIIEITSSKDIYLVGETATFSYPSKGKENIFVSVENETSVLQQFWVNKNAKNEFSILITKNMSPNIYVHTYLLMPHNHTKDGMPMRQHGFASLKIIDTKTVLNPEIICSDKIQPLKKVPVQIKEKNGNAMAYTIAIVDEGLLDLTHYKTPNLWEHINSKKSLGVKSWDIFEWVIGAYSGKIQNLISIGGDGSYEESNDAKANRFKPVVKNLGPFFLNANETKKHIIELPNYAGRVKIMLVAYNNGNAGHAEKEVFVEKPLMILSTIPRALHIQDEIEIPISVFVNDIQIKNVETKIETNEYFEIISSKKQSLSFNKKDEKNVVYKLKVKNKSGIGKIKIIAQSGSEISEEEIEIDVLPIYPTIYKSQLVKLITKQSHTILTTPKGVEGTYQSNINISNKSNIDFRQKLQFLIQYPHGCLEQTTSSAFAQLYLDDLFSLDEKEKTSTSKNIQIAIEKLNLYQTFNGGLSYWSYAQDVQDYATVYAFHFLLEAEKKGYFVSPIMKSNIKKYIQEQTSIWTNASSTDIRSKKNDEELQAYRLYVLALEGEGDISAMNRMKESETISHVAKSYLALAYDESNQKNTALEIGKSISFARENYQEDNNNFGSGLRDQAVFLWSQMKLKNHASIESMCQSIENEINTKEHFNTQELSYTLLAMHAYYKNTTNGFEFQLNNQKIVSTKSNISKSLLTNEKYILENMSNQNLNVWINESYSPSNKTEIPINKDLKISIKYTTHDDKLLDIKNIQAGESFLAHITIQNISNKPFNNFALEYYIPSGWEILSKRYYSEKIAELNNSFSHSVTYDNKINVYGRINSASSKTYVVMLNSTYKGIFNEPIVYINNMYEQSH